MNVSSFFSYNNYMKQILKIKKRLNMYKYKKIRNVYKFILIGISFLISLIIIIYIKENRYFEEEVIYSKNINQSMKLNNLYDSKKKKVFIDVFSKENINLESEKIFGRLLIEKINLDYMVLNEYTEENLKTLLCRLNGDNISENITIIGHNYEDGTFFSNLNKLDINDEIKLIINNKEYMFFVYKIYEVFEYDLEPLKQNGYSEITLITCNNINKKRYIIKAKR